MPENPTKLGVVLTNLQGMDTRALKYLVLYQNILQRSFEFQFPPIQQDNGFLSLLNEPKPIDRIVIERKAAGFFTHYCEWLREDADGYGLTPVALDGFIVLSLARFSDNYYYTGEGNWSIVALGNWKRYMSPPSIVEFFLNFVVQAAIEVKCGYCCPKSHHSTKSCAFDFTASISDARLSALTGFLCDSCSTTIKSALSEQVVEDARVLLKKEWFGSSRNQTDPANTAKKLGYDLFHTRGIKQTLWERLLATIEEEAVKTVFKTVATVVVVALLIWLGLKGE